MRCQYCCVPLTLEPHTLTLCRDFLSAEVKELRKSHAQLMAVSGALVDARTVPVEPYDKAIRLLTKERDILLTALEKAADGLSRAFKDDVGIEALRAALVIIEAVRAKETP
jgi:hypothetical protein